MPRFIPTGVGQTAAVMLSALALSVHPHRRGAEQFFGTEVRHGACIGSSPQAWGKRLILRAARIPLFFGSSPQAWGKL